MMMAAEISRQLKSTPTTTTTTTSSDGKRGHGGGPITRDFLGGGFGIESKELDLDLHVPAGWEKRLDLKSGNVYIQRCNTATSPSISNKKSTTSTRTPPPPHSSSYLQDLNFAPHTKPTGNSFSSSTTLSLFEDTSLDQKLPSSPHSSSIGIVTSSPMMIGNYQSVCTLDKVKSALDRAWRDPPPQPAAKKRSSPSSSSILSGSSSMNQQHYRAGSSSPSSMAVDGGGSSHHHHHHHHNNNNNTQHLQLESNGSYNNSIDHSSSSSTTTGLMVAAACPSCLLYVLVSKNNPKCPKCTSFITLPVMPKKPKIDLNISI